MDWTTDIKKNRQYFLDKTKELLSIPSVFNENSISDQAPFGQEIKEALDYFLALGEEEGFQTKNIDGYAGHIEWGTGEELIGVLGHLDVVPPGEGWTNPAFQPIEKDGKLYARGAQDDKGPVMASFLAMKILKERGFKPNKRVRLILGTDEERNWEGIKYYFKKEEMPTLGFSPDADFPVIHAEKGLIDLNISMKNIGNEQHDRVQLLAFHGGDRLNMVPRKAQATISTDEDLSMKFQTYLTSNHLEGHIEQVETGKWELTCIGVAAHAMEPNNGVNAILAMVNFLSDLPFSNSVLKFLSTYQQLFSDSRGEGLTIACKDDVSGPLTVNVGTLNYHEQKVELGLNIRYPVTKDFEGWFSTFEMVMEENNFSYDIIEHLEALYVEKDHALIQTLLQAYESQTGETGEAHAIGGATYARSLTQGVAFGAMFPNSKETAHQPDECIDIEELLKAVSIYTEALYQLLS